MQQTRRPAPVLLPPVILHGGFEIALGRFTLGYSWERIAADYNLLQGGLMPIGLVLLTLAPVIGAKIWGLQY